jgi:hypothetical protein
MRWAILMLAACGGGDGDDGGTNPSGGVDADITIDGTSGTFAGACNVTESETYLDIAATGDGIGFEIKWRKAIIMAPGTYPTGGIVADIFLFALKGDDLLDATGSVTFTTYTAPTTFAGTFTLTATGVSATGTFDCR